jgi:thiamine biosynthesis lipoprotein
MNRRDFLHPRHFAQTTGHVVAALETEPQPPPPPTPEVVLLRLGRRAMATTFELVLPFDTPNAETLGTEAFDQLDALEDQLTVYRDSEVTRLNRLAATHEVHVEQGLFELLRLAATVTNETAGAFDVTAMALLRAWGFFGGPKRVPAPEEIRTALAKVGMRHVRLDAEGRTVRFLRSGLEINLGGVGKGYALDRVGGWLRHTGKIRSALLHGGRSSVYAIGTMPGDRGWPIDLSHPWETDRTLARVRLRDRAMGTSAATFQHLEHEGRKLGHILDPRTGWPAAGIASATVLAPSAALADALSTAFFVGGVELARTYCAAHPDVGTLLLPDGPDARPIVIGLSHDDLTLSPGGRGAAAR